MPNQTFPPIENFSENSKPIQTDSTNQNSDPKNINIKPSFGKVILGVTVLLLCITGGYFGWMFFEQKTNIAKLEVAISDCNKNLEKYQSEFGQLAMTCKIDLPNLNQVWNWFELQSKTAAVTKNIQTSSEPIAAKFSQRQVELAKSKTNYLEARKSLENLGYKKLPDLSQIQETPLGTLDKLAIDTKMYENELIKINATDQQFATLLQYKLRKFWSKYDIAKQIEAPIPSEVTALIQNYSLDQKADQKVLPKFNTPELASNIKELSANLTQVTMLLTQNIYSKAQNSKPLTEIAQKDNLPKNYAQLPILMYHRIEDLSKVDKNNLSKARKAISITPEVFTNQLDLLKTKGYQTVDLGDVEQAILNKDTEFFDGKKVVITFDDSYPEHYDIAFKELKNRGFKGVFGIITEAIRDEQLGTFPVMTWIKIKEMQNSGMQIISHSASHCALGSYKFLDGRTFQEGGDLRKCDLASPKEVNYGKVGYSMMPIKQVEYEIVQSRQTIIDKTGIDSPYFMFPYGAYNDQVLDIMFQNGFKLGLGVGGGPNIDLDFPFILNRVTVIGDTKVGELKGWFSQL